MHRPASSREASLMERAKHCNKVTTQNAHTGNANTCACIDHCISMSTFSYIFQKHTSSCMFFCSQRAKEMAFVFFYQSHYQGHLLCHRRPPAREIRHLSLLLPVYDCFIFLHTESSTGSCIILLGLERCSSMFCDPSLPLLYHSFSFSQDLSKKVS